ncbi:MAG: hypothetical protein JRI23_25710 [Deltaproteobacteria bacterium]|jgi:hypothetical protein|nr:hypothetical protein [Deltaproteobacteria bacterium]MBW2535424.1 hypothetical protein [Deltaproteobacteria bacterium]
MVALRPSEGKLRQRASHRGMPAHVLVLVLDGAREQEHRFAEHEELIPRWDEL